MRVSAKICSGNVHWPLVTSREKATVRRDDTRGRIRRSALHPSVGAICRESIPNVVSLRRFAQNIVGSAQWQATNAAPMLDRFEKGVCSASRSYK
jgi:hypothetical protein